MTTESYEEIMANAKRNLGIEKKNVTPIKRKPSWRDHVITAASLCDVTFPEVGYVVPGLIPEGVTLLAARPKLGKSWLLLQIGAGVSDGRSTLVDSDIPCEGDVLYLNLEDGYRRTQSRLTKLFGLDKTQWPQRMLIADQWRRLDQGGIDDIRDWCKSVKHPKLIMVDTLKRVRAPKHGPQSDYDADYEAAQPLLELCKEYPGLAVLITHHDRKADAMDVFDTVSGTLGLTGGVDTIAVLKKNNSGVTLYIEGRDLTDNVEKAVSFDRETCKWSILGDAEVVRVSAERKKVMDAVKLAPMDGMKVDEIMAATETHSRPAMDMLLHRMVADGLIEKKSRGRYGPPSVGSNAKEELES